MNKLLMENTTELSYILGALLGDGCIYHWKKNNSYLVHILGEDEFTQKYAQKLSICIDKKINNHFYKSKYLKLGCKVWFVSINHEKLFFLFKSIREDLTIVLNLMKKDRFRENALQFIEGFFDAEGCVKIIKEPVRIIPKICLDICCTNFEVLELIRKLLLEHLGIEARYSIQKAYTSKDGHPRKTSYHLRIYRKEYIRKFLDNINTTKLKLEKINYVKNWLNNKDKKEIITLYHS